MQCFALTGVETTRTVSAETSSYTLDGLQQDSAYNVQVVPLFGSREGNPSVLNVRTGMSVNPSNEHCYSE